MGTMEERMSFLEATVLKQGEAHAALREDLARFESRVDARFNAIDDRFAHVESRFTQLEGRVDRLDDKVSRQFVWLVGMQLTTLVAIIGSLIAVVGTLLARG